MKITYKITQYDVDDFKVIITAPEYLAGLHTIIHTPYFLLSELQQHIKTNLKQTIRRFCIKHNQYADVLKNESFEFEPDEHDKHTKHANQCWFYTGKFVDDTDQDISDADRQAISYKNLLRHDSAYSEGPGSCFYFMVDPRYLNKKPIKIKSLQANKPIDVSRVALATGLSYNEIYKFSQKQKNYCKNKGHSYGNQIVFPRHIEKNGHIYFPISELQKYINSLYKIGQRYPHIKEKYKSIKEHLLKYSENHTSQNT